MNKKNIINECLCVIGHYYSMANGVIESETDWDDSMKIVEDIHNKMDEEMKKLAQRTTADMRLDNARPN